MKESRDRDVWLYNLSPHDMIAFDIIIVKLNSLSGVESMVIRDMHDGRDRLQTL